MAKNNFKIGFVGVGNMASAIIQGITKAGCIDYGDLYLYDIVDYNLNAFCKKGAFKACSIVELTKKCDFIFLCVKPQNFTEILPEIKKAYNEDKRTVFVSIAAGIETSTVSNGIGINVPVIRALPNTPMLIGRGVSAICRNEFVSDEEYAVACSFFSTAGDVITINELEMNRIISVTSSSPAYVFKFIKAICDGAEEQGLDGDALKDTVCNMVIGAAKMMLQREKSPEELISMVCSKGGTTEKAVDTLNSYNFSEGIVCAMKKCTERADELSNINSLKK